MGSASARRSAYERLRAERPRLFVNPAGCPIEILEDGDDVGVMYEDAYIKLVKDPVRFPSGRIGTYIRTIPAVDGTGVVVLATVPDGRIVLVRHFRHGCREWHWEFPRGFGEPGLDGPANVGKELGEELGAAPTGVDPIGRLDDQESDLRVGVYHARIEGIAEHDLTAGAIEEGIDEVRLVTGTRLREMIAGGEVDDMFTLGAYALAQAAGVIDRP
jgi:ADP-ribose pyrophosphatase